MVPLFVRLYAELSVAALEAGVDKELCVWHELRSLNSWGSGRLVLNAVFDALAPTFYSRATLYRLLKAGDGKLWDLPEKGRSKLRIYALQTVAERLNIPRLSRPVLVPASEWFRGRKVKRAWLYASFHRTDGDRKTKPISRDSIEEATGVKRRQQIRYEKAVGVKRVANFAFRRDGDHLVPIMQEVYGKSSTWWKTRRLGNTYKSPALRGHRGMTKGINRLLARSLEEDEARLPKRFFLSLNALMHSPKRHPEAFLRAFPTERNIRGRQEWILA